MRRGRDWWRHCWISGGIPHPASHWLMLSHLPDLSPSHQPAARVRKHLLHSLAQKHIYKAVRILWLPCSRNLGRNPFNWMSSHQLPWAICGVLWVARAIRDHPMWDADPSCLHQEQARTWDDSSVQSKCVPPHLLYQNHCHLIFLFILPIFSIFSFLHIFQFLTSKKPRTKMRDGRETEGNTSVKIENGKKRNQLGFLFPVWMKMYGRKHPWTSPN